MNWIKLVRIVGLVVMGVTLTLNYPKIAQSGMSSEGMLTIMLAIIWGMTGKNQQASINNKKGGNEHESEKHAAQ